jgi:Chalcone isomerase-like
VIRASVLAGVISALAVAGASWHIRARTGGITAAIDQTHRGDTMKHLNLPGRRRAKWRSLLAAGMLCCALPLAAPAAPTSTRFEPAAQLGGTKLQLNGTGTRFKAIFKVYDMALYTPKKVGSVDELLALPGPKRLQFAALRDLPGTDLGRLFVKGMSDNAPREAVLRHTVSTTRLIEIFSGRAKLNAGDSFAMDYVPGRGTQFYIQGQAQGEPVGDAEFFNLVLGIWFGPSPADRALEEALLGREKEGQ